MTQDQLIAFRDLIEAAEGAGWDLDQNSAVLDRARRAYAQAGAVVSEISAARRIEAAVAACELRNDGYEDKSKAGREAAAFGSYIIGRLMCDGVSATAIDAIKKDIASLLALRLDAYWLTAWLRYRCGMIEAALGIPHSTETQAALDARHVSGEGWDAYSVTFKAAPAEQIAIEAVAS